MILSTLSPQHGSRWLRCWLWVLLARPATRTHRRLRPARDGCCTDWRWCSTSRSGSGARFGSRRFSRSRVACGASCMASRPHGAAAGRAPRVGLAVVRQWLGLGLRLTFLWPARNRGEPQTQQRQTNTVAAVGSWHARSAESSTGCASANRQAVHTTARPSAAAPGSCWPEECHREGQAKATAAQPASANTRRTPAAAPCVLDAIHEHHKPHGERENRPKPKRRTARPAMSNTSAVRAAATVPGRRLDGARAGRASSHP